MAEELSNRKAMPRQGRDPAELAAEMQALHAADAPVHHRRQFTPAYFAGEEVLATSKAAFALYFNENHIYSGAAYPSVKRFEADIVGFLHDLMHAPDGAGGFVTIGGSESNIMAVKTARDRARRERPEVTAPEMVVPRTAHPSFTKAAQLLGVRIVRVEASVDYRADVEAMRGAVTPSTILMVGSAPPFAYGVIDPIAEIAAIAEAAGAWMHVDCCLGGLFVPFARELDPTIPLFDFRVPGVTSMSADLHKYGYSVKGVSTLLLREHALEEHARFVSGDRLEGLYITPAIAGTRPAGAIASAWAVMNLLGRQGYLDLVGRLLAVKRELIERIRRHPELEIVGNPQGGIFYVASPVLDMYAVAAALKSLGWKVILGGEPRSIGLMPNLLHEGMADEFAEALERALGMVRAGAIDGAGMQPVYGR